MDEGPKLAQMMVDAGADYISASLGHTAFGDTRLVETHKHPEGSRVYLAEAVKKVLSVPVFTTGKLRTPDVMDSYIEGGRADVLCLGRPLICDADWCGKVRKRPLGGRAPLYKLSGGLHHQGRPGTGAPVRCESRRRQGVQDRRAQARREKRKTSS